MEAKEMQKSMFDGRTAPLPAANDFPRPLDANNAIISHPHGIDLSKSLYHLRLHGFDVVSNDVVSTPPRTFCKTPAVSPVHACHPRRMGALSETRHRMTLRPLAHDFLYEDNRNGTKIMENNEVVIVTPSSSPLGVVVNDDAKIPFGRSHRHRFHSTTITNEVDAVEVMLDSSVSESSEDDNEDCIKSSWNDCVHVSFIDHLPDDEFSISHDNYHSMSPQTPANIDFCGIPNWCDTNANQNIFLDDCSLQNGTLHQRYDGWLCPHGPVWCEEHDAKKGLAKIASMQCMVQNHICMALGDGIDDLCWQQTTSNIIHNYPISSPTARDKDSQAQTSTQQGNMKMHRRSSNLPAYRRQHKFLSMRYNLNPFDDQGSIMYQRLHKPPELCKSKSFQLETAQWRPHPNKSRSRSSQLLDTSDWECGALDFAMVHDDEYISTAHLPPLNLSTSPLHHANLKCSDKDVDGYESDPEFSQRKFHSERFDSVSLIQHFDSDPSTTLQEFLNERCTFIWHFSSSNQNRSIAVHVWIERGQQLYDSLLLPKLCWKPILPQNQKIDDCRSQSQGYTVGGNVSSIELLDICRILPMEKRDNERFPFAVTQRLFSIEATTNNFEMKQYLPKTPSSTSIILEARSIADRVRFMNLLKLTVSTFAAKFLTNDPSTLSMFFHGPSITNPIAN